jgi:hypothetical protein
MEDEKKKPSATQIVKEIKRRTRRKFTTEEKIKNLKIKSKLYLLKINLFFLITVLPSLAFCNVDYNHQSDVV